MTTTRPTHDRPALCGAMPMDTTRRVLVQRALAPLALVATLSAGAVAQVPNDLTELLPTSTVAMFQVEQFGKFALLDEDGPMRVLARHEAVELAFEELYSFFGSFDDDEFLLGLDLEKEELGKLFGGRLLFALPEVALIESDVEVGASTSVELQLDLTRGAIAMADFTGTEGRLEELLENFAQMREDEEDIHKAALLADDVDGTTIFNISEINTDREVDDSLWMALVGELLILSDEEDTLLDFVDLADQGAPEGDRLADDPRYIETIDRIGDSDVLMYVNLGELLPLVNELLEHQLKEAGMSVAMFLRPSDLIAALRLDALETMFASMTVEDDEAGIVFGFTHAETEYGLQTMLVYDDSGVAIPSYFSSDFHSASISNWDVAGAYANFDKMLLKASPTGHGMLNGQIEVIEAEQFPLRDALVNNLGGRFIEILGYPEATLAAPEDYPSQAYVLKLADPQSLAEALAELAEAQGDSQPVEFMNETIHTLPLPPMLAQGRDSELAVAVVGTELVATMGDRKMCENIIAHLKNPGAALLLDDEDLMDAFDALPDDDVVALGFVDVASTLQNVIRGSNDAIAFQMKSVDDPDDLELMLDAQEMLSELPDVSDIHYYLVSKTYKSPDAFIQRMLLRPDLDQ